MKSLDGESLFCGARLAVLAHYPSIHSYSPVISHNHENRQVDGTFKIHYSSMKMASSGNTTQLNDVPMTDKQISQLPDGIQREHIVQAIAKFDLEGMPKGFKPSHTYEIAFEGRTYPPPAIIALAAEQLTGSIVASGFRAGKGTPCFEILETCGFEIKRKPKTNDNAA